MRASRCRLQIFASASAETVLNWMGVPVLRDGNILELPHERLSVVEACSGIRSLLSLGVPVAGLRLLFRPARCDAMGAAAGHRSDRDCGQRGPDHVDGLGRRDAAWPEARFICSKAGCCSWWRSACLSCFTDAMIAHRSILSALLVIQGARVLWIVAARRVDPAVEAARRIFLPSIGALADGAGRRDRTRGERRSARRRLSDAPVLGVIRLRSANLFVAYFQSQRAGQTPHSPKNCLPGSGWTWSVADTIRVDIAGRASRSRSIVISFRKATSTPSFCTGINRAIAWWPANIAPRLSPPGTRCAITGRIRSWCAWSRRCARSGVEFIQAFFTQLRRLQSI